MSHRVVEGATTRSRTKNLNWAMEDALKQMKTAVDRVCAANERTEKKLQSLMSRLENTKVSFVLSCLHVWYFTTAYLGCNRRTKGARG